MDLETYFDFFNHGNFSEGIKYKNSWVPNKLFKYFSFTEDKETNQKKIDCLKNGKVYLSDFNNFNDPFEGNSLILDSQ